MAICSFNYQLVEQCNRWLCLGPPCELEFSSHCWIGHGIKSSHFSGDEDADGEHGDTLDQRPLELVLVDPSKEAGIFGLLGRWGSTHSWWHHHHVYWGLGRTSSGGQLLLDKCRR